MISPHKSVAELGVIGRAEDMHLIVDAERDATLAYLDDLVADAGWPARPGPGVNLDGRADLGDVPSCHDAGPGIPRSMITC